MEPHKFVIKITNIDPATLNHDWLQHVVAKLFEQLDEQEQDLSLGVHGDHHPEALDMIMTAYRKWQTPGTSHND
jgi:hypothetical protein